MIKKLFITIPLLFSSCTPIKINATPINKVVIDQKKLNFVDQTLVTPEFSLKYEAHPQTKDQIESFLQEMYLFLKKEAFYSNEIYTLNEVVFRSLPTLGQAKGFYLFDKQKIYVEFSLDAPLEGIKSALLHEYYHHLTTSYFFSLQPVKHSLNQSLFAQYFDIFDPQKNINSLLKIKKELVYHKSVAYQIDKEINYLIQNNIFKNQNPIITNHPDIQLINEDFWEKKISYLSQPQELIVQSLILQTQYLNNHRENKVIINDLNLWLNYYLHLVLKTNPYFQYQLPRHWIDPYYFWDNEAIAKNNSNITNEIPLAKNEATIKKQFGRFKEFWTTKLFNLNKSSKDLLVSSLIKKNSHNYSLILNVKNPNDKIELISLDRAPHTHEIVKLSSQNNSFYNLSPFLKKQRAYFQSQSFPFEVKNLRPGQYIIKINGQDITSGLKLKKYHNNTLIHYQTNPFYKNHKQKKMIPKYIFQIKHKKIILKVF